MKHNLSLLNYLPVQSQNRVKVSPAQISTLDASDVFISKEHRNSLLELQKVLQVDASAMFTGSQVKLTGSM